MSMIKFPTVKENKPGINLILPLFFKDLKKHLVRLMEPHQVLFQDFLFASYEFWEKENFQFRVMSLYR
jgi:hypothetical protein